MIKIIITDVIDNTNTYIGKVKNNANLNFILPKTVLRLDARDLEKTEITLEVISVELEREYISDEVTKISGLNNGNFISIQKAVLIY